MEQLINSLPRPLLAVLIILAMVLFMWVSNPPHTVCDSEMEQKRVALTGLIFPREFKKMKEPPKLQAAKEACQLGNSAGSCYEYFDILREVAAQMSGSTSECAPRYFEIPEIKNTLRDGLEVMGRIAWGAFPPEPASMQRFAWMQEAELSTFCRVKNAYMRGAGEAAYEELRKKVFGKFPGETPPVDAAVGEDVAPSVKPATEIYSEQEIFERSLFSVRCESF